MCKSQENTSFEKPSIGMNIAVKEKIFCLFFFFSHPSTDLAGAP